MHLLHNNDNYKNINNKRNINNINKKKGNNISNKNNQQMFLAYVNDIWRNIESTSRLFADDCLIYRKIINKVDIEKLQKDLDMLGEWAVENAMKKIQVKVRRFASREPG